MLLVPGLCGLGCVVHVCVCMCVYACRRNYITDLDFILKAGKVFCVYVIEIELGCNEENSYACT